MPKKECTVMSHRIFDGSPSFSIDIDADDWFQLEIRKARLLGREAEANQLEIEWKAVRSARAAIGDHDDDETVFRFLIEE